MNYSKENNKDFIFKILLMFLLDVRAERVSNKVMLKVIKFFEKKEYDHKTTKK